MRHRPWAQFALFMVVLELVGIVWAIIDGSWDWAAFGLVCALYWGWVLSKEFDEGAQ